MLFWPIFGFQRKRAVLHLRDRHEAADRIRELRVGHEEGRDVLRVKHPDQLVDARVPASRRRQGRAGRGAAQRGGVSPPLVLSGHAASLTPY